tara:strand:+ start:464 stop:619 length:156 start_codon:yes stop_codon:yes gene_type:complete
MIEAITLFGWICIIGFVLLVIYLVNNDNDDWTNSKAYRDLNETMLNREEDE